MNKKLISILIAYILVFSIVFSLAGCKGKTTESKRVAVNASAEYEHLVGGMDTLLYQNPDRGYRTEMSLIFKQTLDGSEADWRTMGLDDGYEENTRKVDKLFALYFPGKMEYKSKLVIFYITLLGFNKGDIPQEIFDILDYAFEQCRKNKVKVLFRCGYHLSLIDQRLSEANKQALEKICADQETMLRHMDQWSPFLGKNKDVIHKISAGFIGYGGEQAEPYQYPDVDVPTILKAIVEKICVPNGFQYSSRTPQKRMQLLEAYPDFEYAHLVGFCNDAIYGEQERKGWHSTSGMQWHAENGYWEYVVENSAYTSQSGELLVNSSYLSPNRYFPLKGIEVAAQLAHHRYTTFSQWHTLYEHYDEDNLFARWIENESVTAEMLDAKGMIYDPAWFYNENGNPVYRNPYEYMRDYLGYRITAESANVSGELGEGGKLKIDLTFKNYGFAAAFFLESGFAILNEDYEVVSSVKAGDPGRWISLPEDYFVEDKTACVVDDIIEYTISAELDSPSVSGTYYIAFYLKNTMNDFAVLANDPESIDFVGDGYNVLFTVKI